LEHIEDIIEGCKSGKNEAQRALYNLFQRKMYGVCLRYSSNYAEAEDTTQEGFVKVFRNIHQYKNKGPIGAWIRRIMINTALEKHKKASLLYISDDMTEYENEINYDDIINNITAKDIIMIIQELSPQYKLVFNLYEIDGYSHAEIAEMLCISESTSRSNLLRAKVILQQKILKHFPYCRNINTRKNVR